MQTIKIHTTQNVVIEYQPASVGDRIIANLFDGLITWACLIGLSLALSNLHLDVPLAVNVILYLPFFFYHLLCELFMDGQTFGKRQTRIKVVRMDGAQPSVGNYLMRWLLRPVDLWISAGALAVIVIAVNGKGQRIGDLAAGTTVVSLRRRVNLEDTILPMLEEDYVPRFPGVTALSDRDVAIIKEALLVYARSVTPDPNLLNTLARKVKELIGVEDALPPLTFLQTVLKDHTHLTSQA